MMMAAARAHARWDIEMSNRIFRSKKRMLILAALLIPVIAGGIAFADTLPQVLGSKDPYAPAYYSLQIFLVTIGIGVVAGLITGCIGAGGGFVITPALMSVGIKGILAVGTDLFHIFAKAIMGSVLHRKLGNISYSLAIAFLVGSIIGSTVGGMINRTLYEANPTISDAFITVVYAVMLGFLGAYALTDYFRSRKTRQEASRTLETEEMQLADTTVDEDEKMTGFAEKMQSVNIPPMMKFDEGVVPGGRRISALFLVLSGAFVGLAAAIMGVGGGFLTFPIFVYALGVSAATTVGTDIFQIVFTAGYSSLTQYALFGFVFYTLALGMLIGSILGVQVGSLVTKVVSGSTIRGFYALAILAGFVNRVFALPGKLTKLEVIDVSKSVTDVTDKIGVWVFFIVVIAFAAWVFKAFITNIGVLKGETPSHRAGPPSGGELAHAAAGKED